MHIGHHAASGEAHLAVRRVLDGAVHDRAHHEQPRDRVAQVLDVEIQKRRVARAACRFTARYNTQQQHQRRHLRHSLLSQYAMQPSTIKRARETHFCASLMQSGTPAWMSNSANESDARSSLSPRPSWKNCVERERSRLRISTWRSRMSSCVFGACQNEALYCTV